MNPGAVTGAGLMNTFQPIWYPPITVKWIVTGLIVFAAAVANKIAPDMRAKFTHPVGFFMTALAAFFAFEYGFPPAAFAILFFLLMVWSVQISHHSAEGFLNASNAVDWVTNSRRWFVEKVLKERPTGIQEKEVATFPIQSS